MTQRMADYRIPDLGELVGPFPATNGKPSQRLYHWELRKLRAGAFSGVYCIMGHARRALYVGESHTGRLYDTITRHFRRWKIDPRNDAKGRRYGGTTYDRSKCLVSYILTRPDAALDMQYREIQRLRPRDNANDCRSKACASKHTPPAPF